MQTKVPAPVSTTTEQAKQQQHQPEYETDAAQLLRTPQFEDGRPEVTAQLKQQSLMANSPRTTQLQAMQAMMANSPRVTQLQATQAMMAASPQVQQLKAMQAFMTAGTLAKQNQQGSVAPITQRMEDEEPLQAMAEEPVQREQAEASATDSTPQDAPPSETPKPNNTGLPDQLKTGIENLSGMSMDHVKVHYNSDKPAQLQAHAYAQGSEIYMAPGQEKHLPHEAWHVVQQAQGRVRGTMQMKGVDVNDDEGLEREADLMGSKALQCRSFTIAPKSIPLKCLGSINATASCRAIVQRNTLLSHNFEHNESPVKTITRFVSRNTGHSEADVLRAIVHPEKYMQALYDEGNYKPISVKACIDKVSGSSGRPSSDIQTAVGYLGRIEDSLRGREESTEYDGGHLLGYGWWSKWDQINTAKNIAPQDRKENRSIFGFTGGWGEEEAQTRKIAKSLPVIVTAYANYAGGTYVVSLAQIATLLEDGSDIKESITAMYSSRLRYVTVNARTPKQYVIEHTVLNPSGKGVNDQNENLKGTLPTVWVPTRIPRDLLAPIEDAILRNVLPVWQSLGERGRWGGATVSQNNPWYFADFVGDALKLAQFGVYYCMYVHNMPLVAAAGLVATYFGSGSASTVLQVVPNLGFSSIGSRDVMKELNGYITTAETSLTVDTAIGYSKSVFTYLSSQTLNGMESIITKIVEKSKAD